MKGKLTKVGGGANNFELRNQAEKALREKQAETDGLSGMSAQKIESLFHELRVHQIELEMQNEELRRILVELEKLRDRYSHLYDFSPVGYVMLNEEGIIQETNLTLATMLGLERRTLKGEYLTRFIQKDHQDTFYLHRNRVLETETPKSCDVQLVKNDGQEFYAHLECMIVKESDGDFKQIRCAVSDITERKRTETALRESEDRYRDLVESSQDLICTHDLSGSILSVNPRPAQMLGHTQDELLGMNIRDILVQEARHGFKEYLNKIKKKGVARGLMLVQTKQGERRIWKYNNTLRTEGVGEPIVRGMAHDVTEQKKTEKALRKARDELELRIKERTAELERANEELRRVPSRLIAAQEEDRRRLANELHDSVSQTLAALKFGIETVLLKKDQGDGEAALKHLEQFVPILQRSIEETRAIYMGLRPTVLDNLGLLAAIQWFNREFQRLHPKHHIELHVDISEKVLPEPLKLTIFRISQEALTNVSKHSKAEWVDLSLRKTGESIELTIADDGIGMDLSYILQSDSARCTGLASMRERAELTGGSFAIESTPGEGTTVRASWPLVVQR